MPRKRKVKTESAFQKYTKQILQILEEFKLLIPEEKRELRRLSNKHRRGRRRSAS